MRIKCKKYVRQDKNKKRYKCVKMQKDRDKNTIQASGKVQLTHNKVIADMPLCQILNLIKLRCEKI